MILAVVIEQAGWVWV